MTIRSVSFAATAANAVDSEILTIVAQLVGAKDALTITSGASTSMIQHCTNPFLGAVPDRRAASLTGCVRLLLAGTEMEVTAAMESWVWTAEETVIATVRKRT